MKNTPIELLPKAHFKKKVFPLVSINFQTRTVELISDKGPMIASLREIEIDMPIMFAGNSNLEGGEQKKQP